MTRIGSKALSEHSVSGPSGPQSESLDPTTLRSEALHRSGAGTQWPLHWMGNLAGPWCWSVRRSTAEGLGDLGQDGRIVDRGRDLVVLVIGNLLHRAAEDLAGTRFGQPFHDHGVLEVGDRADLVAHHLDDLLDDLLVQAVDSGLEHQETQRRLALELVSRADDRAFSHILMGRENALHFPGGEAVAGDVDDVVGAGHHIDVAVLVDIARVARLVVAGMGAEVGLLESLVIVP